MLKNFKTLLLSAVLATFIIPSLVSAMSIASPVLTTPTLMGDVDTSGDNSTCVNINSNLSYKNRKTNNKDDVFSLQDFLNTQGYINDSSVTGFFGNFTERAVIAFQRKNGISATPPGFVGAGTRAMISRISCNGTNPVPQPLPQPTTPTITPTTPVPLPAGCTSTTGFSSMTGQPCATTTQYPAISEQVTCNFKSQTEQKCWGNPPVSTAYAGSPVVFSCSGTGSCVVNVKGEHGTLITWGSSCGGSVNTTIGGGNKYASFGDCVAPVQTLSSITVLNPNGPLYWYRGSNAVIEWKTTNISRDAQMLIRLRSFGTNQEYNLLTTNNDGNEKIAVPSAIPAGAYNLEIKTSINGQSYMDSSDSYFKVVESTTPLACTVTAPNATVGVAYSYTTPVTIYGAPTVRLPSGLTANGNVISGVPTTPGEYQSKTYANNSCGELFININVINGTNTTTSVPTVEFIGTPTLSLLYDSNNKESNLYGKVYVKVTAGDLPVDIASIPYALGLFLNNGMTMRSNNTRSYIYDSTGNSIFGGVVQPNTSATFAITVSAPTRELVPGIYTVGTTIRSLQANASFAEPQSNTVYIIGEPASGRNVVNAQPSNPPVTIIGETSPYISSITCDSTPNVNCGISGTRFNPTSNTITVGGITKEITSTSYSWTNATGITFQMTDFGITQAGSYNVQVKNSSGLSNNVVLNSVGVNNFQSTSAPTVEFIGTPTLGLQYSPINGNEELVGKATVKITAGSSPINLYQNSVPGMLQFNNASGATYSNGMRFSATASNGTIVAGNTTISANTSATFTITNTAPTKELFAGSYLLRQAGFQYIDTNNSYQTIQSTSFTNAQPSNSVTIVGETSPYISSAVDSNGYITISGSRLDLPDNYLQINGAGNSLVSKYSPTSSSISFKMDDYALTSGLANGTYVVSVTNNKTGNSNSVSLTIQRTSTPTPTISCLVTAPNATVGVHYSYTTPVTIYGAPTVSLPAGLVANGNVISGVPTTAGEYQSKTYASNSCGELTINITVVAGSVTVPVAPTPAPTITLTASPTTVPINGSTTITWSSTNATSCSFSNGNVNGQTSGTYGFAPVTNSMNLGMTCTGPGGVTQKLVLVTVISPVVTTYTYTKGATNQLGLLLPRCKCDISSISAECGLTFATAIDNGAICYDQVRPLVQFSVPYTRSVKTVQISSPVKQYVIGGVAFDITAPATCQTLLPISSGSWDSNSNGSVSALQKFLAKKYNLNTSDIVSGYYGDKTKEYVTKFQTENNLEAVGYVGTVTRDLIKGQCSNLIGI